MSTTGAFSSLFVSFRSGVLTAGIWFGALGNSIKTLAAVTEEHTGRFFDWEGREMGW